VHGAGSPGAVEGGVGTRAAIDAAIPAITLTRLTNDDPEADSPDEAVLAAGIENVEELVDGYLRGRYELPFVEVPSMVRGLAVNVLRHELYLRRPDGAVPETVQVAYASAVKVLEQIRDGRVTLGIAQGSQAGKSAPAPLEIKVKSRPQRFGGEQWERY